PGRPERGVRPEPGDARAQSRRAGAAAGPLARSGPVSGLMCTSGRPALDAHVVVARPAHRTDVRLRADAGDVVAVIGPNGVGKTTVLSAIAGLVELTDGSVRVQDEDWTHRPVPERDLGVVFSGQQLFPHLDAATNVAFGLRSRGVRRRDAAAA